MLLANVGKQKMNITFLIPDFHRLDLLQKNLPSVLAEARAGDEILVSEDGPIPQTLQADFETFIADFSQQARDKKVVFNFVIQPENLRFARHVNAAVALIGSPYFLLLNNDVQLTVGVREQLLAPFADQSQTVFAVTAQELDVNQANQASGRNRLWWHLGRFWHSRDENLHELGETAWACGGSSMYHTDLWRQLGGFDSLYYPAYWEDIDLSFAATKRGWSVLYQPQAVVLHIHETTNQSVFGQQKITEMSWRGGTHFAWKNSNFWQKLQFLFFYPYWQLKQYPAFRLWLGVLLVALASRLFMLGQVPPGLTVDEAAIAYNGYGIVTQRRDEWLTKLPISFRSFGDYKAPLAIYVDGLFTSVFGLEVWAIRLPFALAAVGSIWLMMLLINLLLKDKKPRAKIYAASIGLLMTLMPWHFHYSRLGFESNFDLFFLLFGLYFFFRFLTYQVTVRGKPLSQVFCSPALLLSSLGFVGALYSYHSSKVVVPLLLLFLAVFYHRLLLKRWRALLLPILLSGFLLWPFLSDSFFGAGLTRANSSFLTQVNLSWLQKINLVGNGFAAHFMPQYLLFGQLNQLTGVTGTLAPNYRQGTGAHGVLSWPAVFLILIFLLSCVRFPKAVWRDFSDLISLGICLIIIGTLPAAITTQVPHSNQAFLAMPGFLLLAAVGLGSWRLWWRRHLEFFQSFLLLFFVCSCAFFLYYQTAYYRFYTPNQSKAAAQISFTFAHNLLPAFQALAKQEANVNQILVSTDFEHEYIYALLARGTKPISYQGGSLSHKYLFLPQISPSDLLREDVFILMSPDNFSESSFVPTLSPVATFYDLTGQPNLVIYDPGKNFISP